MWFLVPFAHIMKKSFSGDKVPIVDLINGHVLLLNNANNFHYYYWQLHHLHHVTDDFPSLAHQSIKQKAPKSCGTQKQE